MCLRNLVHCALCVAVTFAGLAALYLQLDAPFVGWAQILVYVGAVAILIVFAILLTRSDTRTGTPLVARSWIAGLAVAVIVFVVLARAISSSTSINRASDLPDISQEQPTVKAIGNRLMDYYVLPLETMGLLLTAATIGAVIIALREPKKGPPGQNAIKPTTPS